MKTIMELFDKRVRDEIKYMRECMEEILMKFYNSIAPSLIGKFKIVWDEIGEIRKTP